MSPELSPNKKYIKQILDADQLLVKSDLVRLSLLNKEELMFLEKNWPSADVKRRRKIIENLLKLANDNATLNFGGIYSFCLHDSDARIRSLAIKGLALDEDTDGIVRLNQLMLHDTAIEVRAAAAVALGQFALMAELGQLSARKSGEVYSALLMVINKKTESSRVRGSALESIAAFNVPEVRNLIEEAYHSGDIALKTSAITAMGVNCNLEWLDLLENDLDSFDSEIRYAAVRSVGALGSEDSLPYLVNILDDEDIHVQEAAIKAMGEIGGDEARTVLNSLLIDTKQYVRKAARSALKEMDFCEDPLSSNF